MANYTGVHCPVCDKRFTDEDDIVVCPTCGAPHHRSCYQELGHCALGDLHIKGHTWQPQGEPNQAEGNAASGGTTCPACGANNPPAGIFCQVCGAPMKRPDTSGAAQGSPFGGFSANPGVTTAQGAFSAAFGGMNPSEKIEDVTVRDFALFVGPNSHYYIPRFKIMSQSKSLSVNSSAMLLGLLPLVFFLLRSPFLYGTVALVPIGAIYFLYRKLYLPGGLLLALFFISHIPMFFILPEFSEFLLPNLENILMGIIPQFEPQRNLWAYDVMPIFYLGAYCVNAVVSIFANQFYFKLALSTIRKLRAELTGANGIIDEARYTETLYRRGGVSRRSVLISICGTFLLLIILCNLLAPVTATTIKP